MFGCTMKRKKKSFLPDFTDYYFFFSFEIRVYGWFVSNGKKWFTSLKIACVGIAQKHRMLLLYRLEH